MRVLLLRRSHFGSAKILPDALSVMLDQEGIEVVVDDADWIPNKTGITTDRDVSKILKKAAQGFDVVHAWGYRAAWACSEAFYLRFPWIYTAYDMPKTTHPEFIDRLNAAHRAVCSSASVKQVLDEVDTLHLETVMPGVYVPDDLDWSRETARKEIGVRDDTLLVVAMGRFVSERSFECLVKAFPQVKTKFAEARLLLSCPEQEAQFLRSDDIDVRGTMKSVWPALIAADLVVVPSERAGFSLLGAEAMWAGAPVLMRRTGGLVDMAEEGHSAFFFDDDEKLGDKICEILDMEIMRETVARGGQLRSQARYKMERFVKEMAHVYREVGGV